MQKPLNELWWPVIVCHIYSNYRNFHSQLLPCEGWARMLLCLSNVASLSVDILREAINFKFAFFAWKKTIHSLIYLVFVKHVQLVVSCIIKWTRPKWHFGCASVFTFFLCYCRFTRSCYRKNYILTPVPCQEWTKNQCGVLSTLKHRQRWDHCAFSLVAFVKGKSNRTGNFQSFSTDDEGTCFEFLSSGNDLTNEEYENGK